MKSRILVVDDEQDLVKLLSYNLQKEGYEVACAYEGASVLQLVWSNRPDLIILDLMLPDRSGHDICREIKQDERTKAIPIIMLTARSSEHDRVSGFEAGADDYVVKPFSPKELVLRVKAMLARTKRDIPNSLQAGRITIYPDEFRVLVDEQEVYLTATEFQILFALARQPNMVKTREQILDEVWQDEAEHILDRAVDAQVKRLRSKLGAARNAIRTVRGIGYRLTTQDTGDDDEVLEGASAAEE